VERKIKVGAVSYLNTKPLLYGLQHGPIKDEIELMLDYPARLVEVLKTGAIDIGLVPVGALPELGEYHIVSDYCIGTEGEVASVAVFSQVPMEEIETVILDYQSRTSVKLCKLLFDKHWKRAVRFIDTTNDDYIDEIKGTTAGLIIGDRALAFRGKSNYIYDLGLGWKEMTGLPFVFAVWVSINKVDKEFVRLFSDSTALGFLNLDEIKKHNSFSSYDLDVYYNKNISYMLSEEKRKGLEEFLGCCSF
jgi:chorismate dehydratase